MLLMEHQLAEEASKGTSIVHAVTVTQIDHIVPRERLLQGETSAKATFVVCCAEWTVLFRGYTLEEEEQEGTASVRFVACTEFIVLLRGCTLRGEASEGTTLERVVSFGKEWDPQLTLLSRDCRIFSQELTKDLCTRCD